MKSTRFPLPVVTSLLLALSLQSRADILAGYTFGPDGTTPSIYTPATVAPNVVASPIAAHAGVLLDGGNPATQPASTPYLRTTFAAAYTTPAASVTGNADFYFTVTANAGNVINLTSLNFDAMRGGAGTPRGYDVRSSVDNYAATLAAADIPTARPTFTNVNIDLSGAAYQGLSTITFKVFGYSPATGSSVDYDNFTVNGATSPVGSIYQWTGAASAIWNTSSVNWSGVGTVYSNGVSVAFDDSATPTTVTVAAPGVTPLNVGFANAQKAYSFSGGSIAITNGLSKTGAGTVTFNNTVSAGSVQVDDGVLQLGPGVSFTSPSLTVGPLGSLAIPATGSLGASTLLTVNGAATLNSPAQTLTGLADTAAATNGVTTLNGTALTVTGTSSYNGKLTGTGSVTKTTGGVLALGGLDSDYSGGTTVTAGSLRINSALATGTGMVTVGPVGRLVLGADTAATVPVTLSGIVGSTGAAHTLAGDLTIPADATATITSSSPLVPATNLDTILNGVLHGSGTLNITAATGQGDANGGGGVRLRNVTTPSDFSGTIAILGGAKLEIRSAGGTFNAAGATAAIRMTAGATGLTTSTGAFSQINLRTDSDTTYGNNVTLTGTGLVNIFTGPLGAVQPNQTSTLGLLSIGDQQTLISNSGGTLNGHMLAFSAVQLTGGTAGFSPGHVFTAYGQDVLVGPVSETVAGSGFLKSGVNALILTAASSYTGATAINAGTLRLGAPGALPSGTTLTVDGGTVDLNHNGTSNHQTVAALAGAGGIITNSDAANVRTFSVNQGPASSTFSGSINDSIALTKLGSGMLTLAGSNTYTGVTTVSGGTLCLTGTIDNTAGVAVSTGATFCATGPHTVTLNGSIANNGTIRISGGAILDAEAATSFVNNGVLDLLTGTAMLPPGFSNGPGGIVLDSSSLKIKTVARAGTTLTLTIDSYTGHTYQLQRSTTLGSGFVNIGNSQNGTTGTTLSFSHADGAEPRGFYRIVVDP